jgi:hypothetical protein
MPDHEDMASRVRLAAGAVAGVVWAPVEAALAWLTAAAAAEPFTASGLPTPLDLTPMVFSFPDDWTAVPAVTALGGLTVAWTVAGVRIARWATRDHPPGPPSGEAWHPSPEPGDGRPPELPELPGWTAYLDDRGATLLADHRSRRRTAAGLGGGAVVGMANAAALATDAVDSPTLWGFAGLLAFASAAFGAGAVDLAARTPRWVAGPGVVILERRGPGGGVAFAARSLQVDEERGDHGTRFVLYALPARGYRVMTVAAGRDAAPLVAAGAWLAGHAEIPFHDRRVTRET